MNEKIDLKLTNEHFINFEMDFTGMFHDELNVKINRNYRQIYYKINEKLYWCLYRELINDLFNI
jgi:hypothetical protein